MNASEDNEPGRLPSVSSPSPGRASLSASPEVEGYEILRILGEGGMGIVYLARQKHPVQRQVALKIVKPGMDSKQVITRFEAERQALALLDHPNIAQVYDAGTTMDGHPYFSMEYVEGPSITEYCDRQKLSIEGRLTLFVQVCEGVQHAHQKGIIHRDIKPSNVLVYSDNNTGLAKIIDFGVAKALTAPLTEQTFFTEQGQLLGTPEYMSPEQTEMTEQDVDTRSDVYSLGVLLYVLLTGALPFERKELAEAGFAEILRTIREQDPPRPSTRLSGLAEETTQAATNRNTNRGTLTRLVRGDLDWIVMKALEKERSRRYDTTSELAADIKRHLNNEPVQAGPPTMSYRFCKFIRRHRVAALAALLVAASLVTGTVLATYGLYRAYIERDRAVEAEGNAVVQQREAEKQRNEAERQANQAKQSLYCADMLMARENWEDGRVAKLEESLNAYRPQLDEQDLRGWEWYYLKALCNQSLLTLHGHLGAVCSVAWSPNGQYLASAGEDHTVRVWDWPRAKTICILDGHTAQVRSVSWSPGGQRLASAGDDQTVKIWDWAEGVSLLTLRGHDGPVHSVTWSPNGQRMASGSEDSSVRVWDVTTGQESHCLSCESRSQSILSVAWSPDGQWLAAGEANKPQGFHATVILWDLTTLKHRHLDDRTADMSISSVAWSPDGRSVLSTTDRSKIKVWDLAKEENKFSFRGHIGGIRAAWSPDGRRIASAGSDRTIKIWNSTTQKMLTMLCGHKGPVRSVSWSPNGDRLVSGGEDGTVRIWDATRTGETYKTRRFENWVSSVSWSPNGRLLAAADLTPTVQVWDRDTEQEVLNLQGHADKVWCVAWSPDGRRLATASKDKTIKIWNATAGPATLTLSGHADIVMFVAWSPDGKMLASRGQDHNLILWDADTGKVVSSLQKKCPFWEHSVAWSPNGMHLAFAGKDGQVEVWDVCRSGTLCLIRSGAVGVLSIAWNSDGHRLAMGCSEGSLQVCEIDQQRQVFSVREHHGPVHSIAWSPDDERLASGSADGTIKIHNATTGEGVLTLRGHENETFSLAWSPDGKRLASGSWDCTVKIWDASPGYELETGYYQQDKRLIRFQALRSIWKAVEANRLDEASRRLDDILASGDQAGIEVVDGIKAVKEALAKAYHRRGKTAAQINRRYARIIKDYHSALRVDPNCLSALNDLAWVLVTCPRIEFRNGPEAIRLATRACELTGWKQHSYINSLAAAYAADADYEAAAKWQKHAILLLPDDKQPLLQRRYEYRLAQYEAGNAFRGPGVGDPDYVEIHYAIRPPVIDGRVDQIWAAASIQSIVPQGDPADASGTWKALYDSENLYVIVEITDDSLVNDSARSWEDDSVELYFDGGNTKEGPPLKGDNRQYAFGWTTSEIQGNNIQIGGVEHAQVNTATGWCIEIKLPWLTLQGVIPQAGDLIGIDCFYNDDDDGGTTRETQIFTFATDANAWNDASQWGSAVLAAIPVTFDPRTGQEDPSLTIYYSFDKVGQTVLDQSGKHHDAIVVGDVLAEPEGKFGGAANFTSNGYLDLGGPDFSPTDIPISAVTFAAWVRCRNTGGHHAIFSSRSLDGTWLIHPELRSNGKFRWLLRSSGNSTIFDIYAEGVKWDEWLHFAGTYDKISGKAALYVNGELLREIDVARPADIAGDWALGARIGKTIDGIRPFTGLMDEFRILTRALSQDEIRMIMQGM